jgi:ribose transport system substrate-binding protein
MSTARALRAGLVTTAALALAATAVAVPVAAQDEMSGEGKSLSIITPWYASQPATKEAVDLFIADAESRGYETKMVDTAGDTAAVSGEMTSAIAQDFDAIILAFAFSQEIGEGLAAAADADMPVFGLDAGGVADPMLVNVTSDPGDLGRLSAQAIVDALGGPGQVAMIHFDPFEPVRLRAVAAKELFEANDIEIVEYIQGDPNDAAGHAKATVLDLLVKYPEGELDAVWAGWDDPALGAFQATQEIGRPEVLVTGVDGQDFAVAEVAKGENWIATVRQDWPAITSTLADIIDAYFAGTEPAEQTVFVPATLITAENAQ